MLNIFFLNLSNIYAVDLRVWVEGDTIPSDVIESQNIRNALTGFDNYVKIPGVEVAVNADMVVYTENNPQFSSALITKFSSFTSLIIPVVFLLSQNIFYLIS